MGMFVNLWIKLFFVLTPFFALTMFLSLTEKHREPQRRKLALSVSVAVAVICLLLFFAGRQIFSIFGITLDSFRIGAGILLLLSGIGLVHGKTSVASPAEDDVAVVPLAIPIVVGPATTGTYKHEIRLDWPDEACFAGLRSCSRSCSRRPRAMMSGVSGC